MIDVKIREDREIKEDKREKERYKRQRSLLRDRCKLTVTDIVSYDCGIEGCGGEGLARGERRAQIFLPRSTSPNSL